MRALAGITLLILGALGAYAQQPHSGFGSVIFPGRGSGTINRNVSGFGSIIFPGTPQATQPGNRFSVTDLGFAHRLGNTVSGFPQSGDRGRRGRGTTYVPYAYPVYVGGYGYGYGYDQQQQQPNVVVVYPQAQPPVVINQNYVDPAHPSVQEIPQEQPEETIKSYVVPSRQPESNTAPDPGSYYLIAFKDNSIYSAVAYWVDGDTLHYFTAGNIHNQVSLALVDVPLTERLNKERRVDVRLSK